MELTDPLFQERFQGLEVLEESTVGRKWRVLERSSGRRGILEAVVSGSPADQSALAIAESLTSSVSGHIAEVWQVGLSSEGLPFLFREEPVGIAVKDALAADAISQATAIEVACQCLEGLDFLHQRSIWVQNLSPKDIVLTHSEGQLRAKIVDTGVFRSWQEAPGVTAASSVFVGRLKYAAPEQFEESQPFGAPSGIYVLGLILYEMLTGQFPIKGESASSLIAGHLFRPPLPFEETDPEGRLSPELRGVLASMLAKSPDDRFQTASEALSFLRPMRSQESPSSSGQSEALSRLIEAAERADRQRAEERRAYELSAASPGTSTAAQGTETVRLSPEKIKEMREMAAASSRVADGPTAMIRQVRDQVQEEDVQRRAAQQEKARETGLKVADLLRQAKSLAQLEQFQDALSLVREALGLSPDHAEALMLRASLDACLRIQEEEALERQGVGGQGTDPRPSGSTLGLPPIPPVPGAPSSLDEASEAAAASEARTMRISERDLEAARSTSIEPPGSVTLPMATIEEAKRRAAELQAREGLGPKSTESVSPSPSPSVTRVDTDVIGDLTQDTPPDPNVEQGGGSSEGAEASDAGEKPEAPAKKIEAFGSVTLPMAVVQEAKRRHLEQQRPQEHAPHEGGSDPSGSVSGGPRDVTLPPMPVGPNRPSSGGLEVEPYGGVDASPGRPEAQPAGPVSRDPVGRDPVSRDPVGRDPVGRDPVGRDPVSAQPPAASVQGAFVDDRPAVDRTLSDFGFGGGDPEPAHEPPMAGMYPPTQQSRRGGPPDGRWVKPMAIVGLIAALGLVFALSFFLSGRLADGESGSSPSPILPAEDVQGTNLPPGWLALDASPWGEIQSVASAGGESIPVVGPPYTPKLLELPPGQYTVMLIHPAGDQPVEVTLEVETGKTTRHLVNMEIDLDELLARSGW